MHVESFSDVLPNGIDNSPLTFVNLFVSANTTLHLYQEDNRSAEKTLLLQVPSRELVYSIQRSQTVCRTP
jgi:hypothetical protein